jgi:hypothetical protein
MGIVTSCLTCKPRAFGLTDVEPGLETGDLVWLQPRGERGQVEGARAAPSGVSPARCRGHDGGSAPPTPALSGRCPSPCAHRRHGCQALRLQVWHLESLLARGIPGGSAARDCCTPGHCQGRELTADLRCAARRRLRRSGSALAWTACCCASQRCTPRRAAAGLGPSRACRRPGRARRWPSTRWPTRCRVRTTAAAGPLQPATAAVRGLQPVHG